MFWESTEFKKKEKGTLSFHDQMEKQLRNAIEEEEQLAVRRKLNPVDDLAAAAVSPVHNNAQNCDETLITQTNLFEFPRNFTDLQSHKIFFRGNN